jgi:hypothetical protein
VVVVVVMVMLKVREVATSIDKAKDGVSLSIDDVARDISLKVNGREEGDARPSVRGNTDIRPPVAAIVELASTACNDQSARRLVKLGFLCTLKASKETRVAEEGTDA